MRVMDRSVFDAVVVDANVAFWAAIVVAWIAAAVREAGGVSMDYEPAWIDLGSHNGDLYGIFYKVTNKATVWYNPKALAAAGLSVPGYVDRDDYAGGRDGNGEITATSEPHGQGRRPSGDRLAQRARLGRHRRRSDW